MALTQFDRDLLKRCLDGAPGAWQDFVDRFIGLFVHVIHHTAHARSVRLGADDVDDLCSEVFVTLLKDDFAVLRNFRGQSSLATYLTVVSRRLVVREMARRRKAAAMGHVDAHQPDVVGHLPEEQRIDDVDEVQQLMQHLPANEAEIVRQYHLEGKTYRQISSSLKISQNSIGPTLTRARERLRQLQLETAS
ncbi:RNA polymerase sigma factor [Maioricimonas rarisocia]|uniref:RNA polymerase sigma factor n=1 Tax=Maioricimonas rarisocia TaxID=2528026 RepID=A0A517Z7M7_9PLAN|nr:sigma-70 family RNA polymerase sigma factor [Maioricimonas rarisocia]QDU38490.1 RNA polymerase sigma factor [Maioricimonas rarisocia]